MKFKQINYDQSIRFVNQFHRHSKKPQGHKFSIGLFSDEGELIGVGICGRPIARNLDDGNTIEITRVCVKDGYKNANSMIYGRLKRICQLFGYEKIFTYTLETESGSSLKAIKAIPESTSKPQQWNGKSRRRAIRKIYDQQKIRWTL